MLICAPKPLLAGAVQIIPSVLPADWANMGAECKRLEDAGVDRIQFDVMDGNFVPNLTFGPEMIAACRKYTKVSFETQLMVSNYNCETMLDEYTKASLGGESNDGSNVGVVIAHVEGNVHLHRTLTKIREGGGSPSVALNPHTPAEMIENVLDLVDHVLVMTVNPGFGGQAYIPTMVDKIKKIRGWVVDRGLNVDIEVDGGVKADWTIAACADAGANWCVRARFECRTAPEEEHTCQRAPRTRPPMVRRWSIDWSLLMRVPPAPSRTASSPARACSSTTTSRSAARSCAPLQRPRRGARCCSRVRRSPTSRLCPRERRLLWTPPAV
jgi:ribulose-phosphate 3-epimerase